MNVLCNTTGRTLTSVYHWLLWRMLGEVAQSCINFREQSLLRLDLVNAIHAPTKREIVVKANNVNLTSFEFP